MKRIARQKSQSSNTTTNQQTRRERRNCKEDSMRSVPMLVDVVPNQSHSSTKSGEYVCRRTKPPSRNHSSELVARNWVVTDPQLPLPTFDRCGNRRMMQHTIRANLSQAKSAHGDQPVGTDQPMSTTKKISKVSYLPDDILPSKVITICARCTAIDAPKSQSQSPLLSK